MRKFNCRNLPWLASLVLVVGCSGAVPAPTGYTSYSSKDGTFECDLPDDWPSEGGAGKRGPTWVKATNGGATIRVEADLAGSLIGDIAGGGMSSFGDGDPDLEPVAGVHEFGLRQAEEMFSGYKEVGGAAVVDCKLGPARKSEFTASSGLGGSLHGYRATVLGRDKRVVVYCSCAESDWLTLEPAFAQVITSLERGIAQ